MAITKYFTWTVERSSSGSGLGFSLIVSGFPYRLSFHLCSLFAFIQISLRCIFYILSVWINKQQTQTTPKFPPQTVSNLSKYKGILKGAVQNCEIFFIQVYLLLRLTQWNKANTPQNVTLCLYDSTIRPSTKTLGIKSKFYFHAAFNSSPLSR